jgi:hypothetical protein
MNKLITKFAGLFAFVLMVSMATTSTGCNKDINCKAVITVVYQATGQPVAGAQVDCKSGDVTLTSTTDGSGTANFETNLPMILDIYVNGNPTGRVARFEDDKTDNVTVEI